MERLDFQQRGVLEQFPELSYERCMKELILLTPDGKQLGGVQAIVHVLATRRWIGWVAFIYYLPILRQLLDLLYRFIAWNRYRIMGKAIAKGECESGACQVHFSIQKSEKNEGHLRGTDDLD